MFSVDKLLNLYESAVANVSKLDGVALLMIRLIVAPVMIVSGYNKLALSSEDAGFPEMLLADPNVVNWFGNSEWGLGLPFPELMGFMAGWTEFLGGWFVLFGLLTRLWSIPLLVTMFVAATAVHWDNGWYAVAPSNSSTSPTQVFQWLGFDAADKSAENAVEVKKRLNEIREIVNNHEYADWLTAKGNVVILNNGIEFAATYFVMFFLLLLYGGGRFTSADYYLRKLVFK